MGIADCWDCDGDSESLEEFLINFSGDSFYFWVNISPSTELVTRSGSRDTVGTLDFVIHLYWLRPHQEI